MSTTIGANLRLDGEKEFKAALKESNESLKVLGSELKLVAAEYDKNDKSVEALSKQQDVLSRTVLEQQDKVKLLSDRLTEAARAFGETDSRTKALQVQLNNANAELVKTQKELDGVTADLKAAEAGENDAGDAAEKAGKQAKESGDKAEKGGEGWKKLGSVCKATAAAMGAAVAAAATAAFKLGKDVVNAFAESEQLLGGVETLFGESASIVESNANKAFKTAGLSANEYMETVTGFSASLLQSLEGDTEEAARLADQAIIDMADNANKMGSDMSSIQTAYSGFAKQNFTMLDNLKLGYGGTKAEMERLLEDATALSGIEYDISSYADIIDAIHVIQTEMGITGTTAEEATQTISGSLAALDSSYKNLLTGLGNSSSDIGELASYCIDAALTVLDNVLPVINQLVEAVPEALDAISSAALGQLPMLLETAVSLFETILEKLLEMLPELIPIVIDAVMLIVNTLMENLPLLVESGIQLVMSLIQGLAATLPDLIPLAVDAILVLVDTLTNPDNLGMMIDAAIELVMALAEGLIDAIPKLVAKAPEIVINLVESVIKNAPKMVEAALELILSLCKGLVDSYGALLDKGREIVDEIKGGFQEKVDNAKTWGEDLISNFVSGIKQKWEDLKESVRNVAQTVKDFIGFSQPKLGPLADFSSYSPDMVDLFIKGLKDNTRRLQEQLSETFTIQDPADSLPVYSSRAALPVSESNTGALNLTLPITMDGQVLTTMIAQIQWEQGQAYVRNLGRAM